MSIQGQINSLRSAGTLHLIPQSWPGLPIRRVFLASESVRSLILGPAWNDQKEEDRAYGLRAEIDWFIDGHTIYVRPESEDGTKALFARLNPSADEVWTLRSLKPKPSLRVFGTFADRDVFVALHWAKRTDLGAGDSEEWADAIGQFKTEWHNCFFPFNPLHGSYPDAYLSNAKLI
jgi:hypothetical protein